MADLNNLILQNVKELPEIENASDMTDEDSLIVVQDNTTKKASFKFLTDYSIDATFKKLPEWVKGTEKPTYTADEVGADSKGSAQSALSNANKYTDDSLKIYATTTSMNEKLEGKSDVDHNHTISEITDFPNAMPANGGNADTVNGHTVNSDVPANAKFTDTTYENFVKSGTGAKSGLVPAPSTTAGTKKYLREDGTWQVPPDTKTTVDSALSTTSTNPVQNKIVSAALGKKSDTGHKHTVSEITDFETVINGKGYLTENDTISKATADAEGNVITETYATKTENSNTLASAKTYTDTKISNLVGSAPETLDTLEEISKALDDNADIIDAVIAKIPTKTSQLTNDSNYVTKSGSITGNAGTATSLSSTSLELTLAAGKINTWSCMGYWPISLIGSNSWTSNFRFYDPNYLNGVYDVWVALTGTGSGISRVNFVSRRVDGTNPATDNIVIIVTSTNVEFWIKQITNSACSLYYTNNFVRRFLNNTDTSLRSLASLPTNRGTVYHASATDISAKYDAANNEITETYATKEEVNEKLDSLPVAGHTHKVSDITDLTTFVKSGSGAKSGLVPAPSTTAGTKKYLREDGTWQVPPDTKTTVDSALSTTSTNPVQNKIVSAALDTKRPLRQCIVGQSGSTITNPYYKFASISVSQAHYDSTITFKVSTCYGDKSTKLGILTAHFRTTSAGYFESGELVWEYAVSGIDNTKFMMVHNTDTKPTVVELWAKIDISYTYFHFEVMFEGLRDANKFGLWTLYNVSSAGSEAAVTTGYTVQTSTYSTLKNSISGNSATASRTAYYSSNVMTTVNTWTCFAVATLSSWFPHASQSRFMHLLVYDTYGVNGVYDISLNIVKSNNVFQTVTFVVNRLDTDDPSTDNILLVISDTQLELWFKASVTQATTICLTGVFTNSPALSTSTALRNVALSDVTSRGTVYHATSIALPTKTSQLTNDSGFITTNATVTQARNAAAYKSNVFIANKAGTWTCFGFQVLSYWLPSDDVTKSIRMTIYDSFSQNGVYDIYAGFLKTGGSLSKVNFVANRLDADTTETDNIVMVVTSERIEFWIKQLGVNSSRIWITGLESNGINLCTDSALAGLSKIPTDRGTFYYPTSSAIAAKSDASGNIITDTYATKASVPTKLSQLTNDASYAKTSSTVTGAYTVVQSVIYGNSNASKGKKGTWSKVCYWDIATDFATKWVNRTVSFTLTDMNVGQGTYEIFLSVRKNTTGIAFVKLLADRLDTEESTTDRVAVIVTSTQVQLWMKADTTDYVVWLRLNNSGYSMKSYNGADAVTNETGYEYLTALPTNRGKVYKAVSRRRLVEKAKADINGNRIDTTYAKKASSDESALNSNSTVDIAKATKINSGKDLHISGNSGKYAKIASWDYKNDTRTNFRSSFTLFDIKYGLFGKDVVVSIDVDSDRNITDAFVRTRPMIAVWDKSYEEELYLVDTSTDVELWLKCPSYINLASDIYLTFLNQSGDIFERPLNITMSSELPTGTSYAESNKMYLPVNPERSQTISGSKTFANKHYVTGTMQQSGAKTDYSTYRFRNIAMGTGDAPTDATYGGSGSIYIQY